jgi:hypothetical protein
MKVFTERDLQIIKDNIDLPPRKLIPMLEGDYTPVQVTKFKWYIKNRDNVLERQAKYREENREKILETQKKWREKNKEYERERHRKWREENHEYDLKRRKVYRRKLKKKYNIPDRWGGKGQALVRGYAEEVLGAKAQEEVTFDWLVSDKGYLMPVDIYFPDHNLIIEYNGQQHYFPVDFGSGMKEAKKRFEAQKSRDLLKYKLILEHGFNLLVIPYNFSKNTIVELVSQYKKGGDANG